MKNEPSAEVHTIMLGDDPAATIALDSSPDLSELLLMIYLDFSS